MASIASKSSIPKRSQDSLTKPPLPPPEGSTRLCYTPPPDLKREIVQRFWRRQNNDVDLDEYSDYFDFYKHTCKALYLGVHCEADTLAAQTHEHVLIIIDTIWRLFEHSRGILRPMLRELLRAVFGTNTLDTALDASIDLALHLWLTIDAKSQETSRSQTQLSLHQAVWTDGEYLFEFICRQFPGPAVDEPTNILLGNELRAVNLERLSGVSITWTSCLKDHMLFDGDTRSLKVYYLKQVLQEHMMS